VSARSRQSAGELVQSIVATDIFPQRHQPIAVLPERRRMDCPGLPIQVLLLGKGIKRPHDLRRAEGFAWATIATAASAMWPNAFCNAWRIGKAGASRRSSSEMISAARSASHGS
jgi:hypothetical protein